jgi:hypothetical protein
MAPLELTITTVPSLRPDTASSPETPLGVVTRLQLVPFQFAMPVLPTAQISVAHVQHRNVLLSAICGVCRDMEGRLQYSGRWLWIRKWPRTA